MSSRGRVFRMSAEQVLNHLLPALAFGDELGLTVTVEHHEDGYWQTLQDLPAGSDIAARTTWRGGNAFSNVPDDTGSFGARPAMNLRHGLVRSVIVWIVVGILLLFSVVTIWNMDPSLLAPSGYPDVRSIVSSTALTFFAFLGFGVISFTARDLANPAKQPPKAMYLALAIATTTYVLVALGVFGTLTVQQVIDSGGTAIAVPRSPPSATWASG